MTASIEPTGESWLKCHACEYKKSLRYAVKEISAKTPGGRFAKLVQWVDRNDGRGTGVRTEWREEPHDYTDEARALIGKPYPAAAIEFLKTKGITDPGIIRNNVVWSSEHEALIFPTMSYRQGKLIVVGAAARRLRKEERKYWTVWEYEPYFHLYGEHRLREWRGQTVLIVEGQLDVLHCWQCGVPAVALMGVSYSKMKGVLLQKARIRRAIIVLDPDVYDTDHRKRMVIDSTIAAIRALGIEAWDEKLEKDPKHLDAETLLDIIKKPRILEPS